METDELLGLKHALLRRKLLEALEAHGFSATSTREGLAPTILHIEVTTDADFFIDIVEKTIHEVLDSSGTPHSLSNVEKVPGKPNARRWTCRLP